MKFYAVLALCSLAANVALANAQVILKYDAATKNDVIKAGTIKKERFTGTNVILSKTSKESVALLLDEEYDPEVVCYTGDANQAKEIVENFIGNIDGNGDYYLDEMIVEVLASKSVKPSKDKPVKGFKIIRAKYKITGEGGQEPHNFRVSTCK